MNNQRIIWFQDSIKFGDSGKCADRVDKLTDELITLVGHPEFDHVVIDPFLCFEHLLERIDFRDFSSVIDLTGVLEHNVGNIGIPYRICFAFIAASCSKFSTSGWGRTHGQSVKK